MTKRLALLAAALLAPSIASAQITITESNDSDLFVNIQECLGTSVSDNLSFTWNFPGFVAGGSYTLTASDTVNCPASTTTQAVRNVTIKPDIPATSSAGTYPTSTGTTVAVSTLLLQLGIPASCNAATTSIFFCVTLSSASTAAPATGSLGIDLANPPAPTVNSATPGDSALNVSWTRGSSTADAGTPGATDSYKITATNHDNPSETHITDFITPGSTTGGRVEGLTNGVVYDVTVQAFSPGRNPSAVSNTVQGTPVQVNDFWRLYKADDGRETGGCAAGAASMIAILAVPLALRAWRRRS